MLPFTTLNVIALIISHEQLWGLRSSDDVISSPFTMKSPKSSFDLQSLLLRNLQSVLYQISNAFTIISPVSLSTKSSLSSLWNLPCLHHLISSLFTMKSPISSLSNLRCLYHWISNLFTMKSPVSSLSNLRCLLHSMSSLFTMKSPDSSLRSLQSQYCTSTSSSDTPISAARATPGSQNKSPRTVNSRGYELYARQ